MRKFLVFLVICICTLTGCDKKPTPDYFSERLVDVELAYAQHPEDINKPDEEETTPLVNAIINNDIDIVKFLLANDADPNYIPNQETEISPLGYATLSETNKSDIIKVLVENGADVNGHTNNGITPIMHAMLPLDNHPNIENIKTLLSYKPDVNAVDNNGYPVLFWALHHSNDMSDVIELLIEHGANLNNKYHDGDTTILTQSIHFGGHINNIRALIENGEDVNQLTNNKWSALMEAIETKNQNVIKLLLDNKADIDITTKHGNTGLMYLARDEDDTSEIMELLLRYGAKIDQQNDLGQPALFFAAEHGHINNLKTLLKHGADAKIKENDGCSVLIKAILMDRPLNIVKLLIPYSDLDESNQAGATALLAAIAKKDIDVVKLLVDGGANINQHSGDAEQLTPLTLATSIGDLQMVQYLVERGANVNDVDGKKLSALIIAADSGYLDIVKYLVDHGANIDYDLVADELKDSMLAQVAGWTALNKAIQRNHLDVAEYLISKGASQKGMVMAANMSFNLDTMRYVSEISTEKSVKDLKQAVQTCDIFLANMAHITVKNVPADKQKDIAGTNFAEATYLYVYLTMIPQSKRTSKYDGLKHTDIDYLNAYKHTLKELEYRNLLYAKSTDETLDDISEYFAEKTLVEEPNYLGILITPPAFMCTMLHGIINE